MSLSYWMQRRRSRDQELDEELAAHLRMAAQERVERGETPEQARLNTHRELGNIALTKEVTRQMWPGAWLDTVWQNLLQTVRLLRRSPGFALGVIAMLGLGVGATTAMFSLVDSVLLRPLPYPDANRLVLLSEYAPRLSHQFPSLPVSGYHIVEWRQRSKQLAAVAALMPGKGALLVSGVAEPVNIVQVSANLFAMLGVQPERGRLFTAEEELPGRNPVILISHALWQSRYNGDPQVLGRNIVLQGRPRTVIGVLPARTFLPASTANNQVYRFEPQPDVWVPIDLSGAPKNRGNFSYTAIGQLQHGVTAQQAEAEAQSILQELARQERPNLETFVRVTPLHDDVVREVRSGLLLLLTAVSAVLLIVCVNLSSLLLARSHARQREFAVRAAVGAGGRQLGTQVLCESLLLAAIASVCALGVAHGLLRLILRYAPLGLARAEEIGIHPLAYGFVFLMALLSALFFSIYPARQVASATLNDVLRPGQSAGYVSRASSVGRNSIVAVQVGISALLLITAGLMLNSLVHLLQVERGYDIEHLLSIDVNLPRARYNDSSKTASFYNRVLQSFQARPEVVTAGVVSTLPLTGERNASDVYPDSPAEMSEQDPPVVSFRFVNPSYPQTMGISLLQGRWLTEADASQRVALISQRMAQQLWPGSSPLGREFRRGDRKNPPIRVVGIVEDIRDAGLEKEPRMLAYQHQALQQMTEATLVVRTRQQPEVVAGTVRSLIRQADPEVPLSGVRTMEEVVSASTAQRRFQLTLLTAFAITALLLACLGIYGVVSYNVGLRTNEIGIRMALGGQRHDVRRLVLGQSMRPVLFGLGLGVLTAIATTRLLSSFLFGVQPHDPLTYSLALLVLTACSALACYVPIRYATRVDPLVALRNS